MIDNIWLTMHMPSYKLNELSLSSESSGRDKESAKVLDRERGFIQVQEANVEPQKMA
jgi:hypothetical protein